MKSSNLIKKFSKKEKIEIIDNFIDCTNNLIEANAAYSEKFILPSTLLILGILASILTTFKIVTVSLTIAIFSGLVGFLLLVGFIMIHKDLSKLGKSIHEQNVKKLVIYEVKNRILIDNMTDEEFKELIGTLEGNYRKYSTILDKEKRARRGR